MYLYVMPAVASACDRRLCDSVQGVGCVIHALLVTCKLKMYSNTLIIGPRILPPTVVLLTKSYYHAATRFSVEAQCGKCRSGLLLW